MVRNRVYLANLVFLLVVLILPFYYEGESSVLQMCYGVKGKVLHVSDLPDPNAGVPPGLQLYCKVYRHLMLIMLLFA